MEELLRLENICYQYENGYVGLKGVSAAFSAGERVAVLGGNGAGKSTFFLCCNGVLRPQQGKVFLKGREISGNKKDLSRLRQSVGLVFQEPDSQIIAGTVEAEISFGPVNLGLPDEAVRQRIGSALEQMNLVGYELRAPQYLSGGEKKRVSIADILAMHPEMILLDEPTASLDPQNVILLEHTLEQLSGAGIALVISTHDVDFACRFAQRAIVFSQGEIIADNTVDAVFGSDEILRRAGLRKPLLYAAAEALDMCFAGGSSVSKPRNMEEFRRYAEQFTTRR